VAGCFCALLWHQRIATSSRTEQTRSGVQSLDFA
jgi:hypothetical protein